MERSLTHDGAGALRTVSAVMPALAQAQTKTQKTADAKRRQAERNMKTPARESGA